MKTSPGQTLLYQLYFHLMKSLSMKRFQLSSCFLVLFFLHHRKREVKLQCRDVLTPFTHILSISTNAQIELFLVSGGCSLAHRSRDTNWTGYAKFGFSFYFILEATVITGTYYIPCTSSKFPFFVRDTNTLNRANFCMPQGSILERY